MRDSGSSTAVLERLLTRVRAQSTGLDVLASVLLGVAVFLATQNAPVACAASAVVGTALVLGRAPRDWARQLERRDRGLEGAVLAFAEGGGGRLRDSLAGWILERDPRASHRREVFCVAAALAACAGALWFRSRPHAAAVPGTAPRSAASAAPAAASPSLEIAVEITPPAYAHRGSTRIDSPSTPIRVLRGSTAVLEITTATPRVELAAEGRPPRSLEVAGGRIRETLELLESTAFRVGGSRIVVFEVARDEPPEVELVLPREDLNVTSSPGTLDVKAEARDDVGLESLALFYTLAHGHGEGMSFKSGRVDGPHASGRMATLASRLDPAALGLGAGDTLVIWAEAADGNAVDGPARTASSVRIVRWEESLARLDMKASAPAVRPLNGPLSQREILARTLRLLGERLPKAKLLERSQDLAGEQEKLRTAFGFFLRAENGNAIELDVESRESGVAGSDRTRALLAEAVSEMWSSESDLASGNAAASVPHQRLALARLDEAFGNERYALRALAPPKAPVDEARRLKGDAKGLASRTLPDPPDERPDPSPLKALARRLLLAAEAPSSAPDRTLADALWALPETAHLSRASLAAPLYAAKTQDEFARAARAAADALLHALAPDPAGRPAAGADVESFFRRLDGGERPLPRAARREESRESRDPARRPGG